MILKNKYFDHAKSQLLLDLALARTESKNERQRAYAIGIIDALHAINSLEDSDYHKLEKILKNAHQWLAEEQPEGT